MVDNNVDEKRKEQRTDVNWHIEAVLNNKKIDGVVKNITLNGILVCCDQPLGLDKDYHLLIFPPHGKAINVVGKPLWSDSYALDSDGENTPVCTGIIFVKISPIDHDLLKDTLRISIRK
jgi:hypothetical protein